MATSSIDKNFVIDCSKNKKLCEELLRPLNENDKPYENKSGIEIIIDQKRRK